MSNKDFGGKMVVKFSTGQLMSLRGTFNSNPTRNTASSIVNQDRSVDRIHTPRAPSCEISFADRGINYDQLMEADRFNVTIDEDFTGVTHYYTRAFVTGAPQVNRMTGEVTNFTIEAEAYSKRKGS